MLSEHSRILTHAWLSYVQCSRMYISGIVCPTCVLCNSDSVLSTMDAGKTNEVRSQESRSIFSNGDMINVGWLARTIALRMTEYIQQALVL